MSKHLQCQMAADCKEPVTHIDNKGYVYCTKHGVERRDVKPCRKMLKYEIAILERGESIWWDSKRNRDKRTAAPELLEACQRVLELLPDHQKAGTWADCRAILSAAISKAKGGAECP